MLVSIPGKNARDVLNGIVVFETFEFYRRLTIYEVHIVHLSMFPEKRRCGNDFLAPHPPRVVNLWRKGSGTNVSICLISQVAASQTAGPPGTHINDLFCEDV